MRLSLAVVGATIGYLTVLVARSGSGQQSPNRPPHGSIEHDGPAEHGSPPSAPECESAVAPSPKLSTNRPKRRYQPRSHHSKWTRGEISNAVSAVATVAGAVFAAGALFAALDAVSEARRQANIAQAALVTADRPWIKVVNFRARRIEVEKDVVWANTTIQVKNIGRSPALRTFVSTKLISDPSITEEDNQVISLCRDAEKTPISLRNRMVFPDDATDFFEVTASDMREIKSKRDGRLRWERDVAREVVGDEAAEKTMQEKARRPLYAGFALIGCITYEIPNRQAIGQTTFSYGLDHACGLGPWGVCAFDMTRPALYEGKALSVREAVSTTLAQ